MMNFICKDGFPKLSNWIVIETQQKKISRNEWECSSLSSRNWSFYMKRMYPRYVLCVHPICYPNALISFKLKNKTRLGDISCLPSKALSYQVANLLFLPLMTTQPCNFTQCVWERILDNKEWIIDWSKTTFHWTCTARLVEINCMRYSTHLVLSYVTFMK